MVAETVRVRGSYMTQAPDQPLHELRLFATARFRKVVEYNLLGQTQNPFQNQLVSNLGR